ncbi:MAG TPA: hypothetical protein DCS13_08115 [Candidatus Margulisbacteria bacterium]|nr:MAG: hypothetical protein A2X43_14045 [Candidatus Margulisbacteria bacterium GWD2_39_127]HAR63412.1 hypothetical protein [Candidatus Margulisiibacteriota bacterium]
MTNLTYKDFSIETIKANVSPNSDFWAKALRVKHPIYGFYDFKIIVYKRIVDSYDDFEKFIEKEPREYLFLMLDSVDDRGFPILLPDFEKKGWAVI